MANLLTVIRVLVVFAIIAVWSRDAADRSWFDFWMVPLLAWAIYMDALDGWVARKLNESSEAGALFDIAGDRIVELTLWVFFATARTAEGDPLVPLWIPLVLIARTVLTDFVRSVAFRAGRTPFGPASLQQSAWARELTASRWSRAAYGGMKAVAFCALGLLVALPEAPAAYVAAAVDALVYVTVGFAIVRGVPVLWDGWNYVRALSRPAGAAPIPSAAGGASLLRRGARARGGTVKAVDLATSRR